MSLHPNSEDSACAAALAALPGMGPIRLSALLTDQRPSEAWELIRSGGNRPAALGAVGGVGKTWASWTQAARRINPYAMLEHNSRHGVSILFPGNGYPAPLIGDPAPPAVLFAKGDTALLERRRVAIVGTRQCTASGRSVARRFGCELAEAGVAVVSGLALGIDGAAHRGVLEADAGTGPVAVVGSGLDRVYPRRNADVWDRVGRCGLLLSEAPLGALPEPWRFPARNRIIAGLAELLVVIESHESGGSLLTVDEALARSVPVGAVPGPVTSPASAGTNYLLADGALVVCSTDDILRALSLDTVSKSVPESAANAAHSRSPYERAILAAVGWEATPLEAVLQATGLTPRVAIPVLEGLCTAGSLIRSTYGWARRHHVLGDPSGRERRVIPDPATQQ